MRAAALLLLAACSAPPAPAPLASHAAHHAAPTSPPPTVAFANMQLAATGLPAIAADGSVVVYAVVDGDGGRGNPNMTLVVQDRNDRERERIIVVTANQSEAQFDDRGPSPQMVKWIATANERLSALHETHDVRPITKLASEANPLATDEGNHAQGEGLLVDVGARLTIRTGTTTVVDRPRPASWLVPDRKMCASCSEVCRHPMFLGAAHGDLDHQLVLLTISYAGTDLCPEPTSQHHVLAW